MSTSRQTVSRRQPPDAQRALALCAAAVLVLSARASWAGALHVAVAPLPCGDSTALAREIERRAAPHMQEQSDLALLIDVTAEKRLRLQLVGGRNTLQRTMPLSAEDCDALPVAAVLLVRSWMTRDWSEPLATEAPVPPRLPVQSEVAPANEAGLAATNLAIGAVAGMASGFAAGDASVSGAVVADLALRGPLGLAFGAGYEGSSALELRSGRSLAVDMFLVGAGMRFRVTRWETSGIDLLTGPALRVLGIRRTGFAADGSNVLAGLAWDSGLRLHVRAGARLVWLTSLDLALAGRVNLIVNGATASLTVSPVRLAARTGIAWEAF